VAQKEELPIGCFVQKKLLDTVVNRHFKAAVTTPSRKMRWAVKSHRKLLLGEQMQGKQGAECAAYLSVCEQLGYRSLTQQVPHKTIL
jgi:hypothetical protein